MGSYAGRGNTDRNGFLEAPYNVGAVVTKRQDGADATGPHLNRAQGLHERWVDGADRGRKARVGDRPRRGWPYPRGIEAALGLAHHAAQPGERVIALLRRDEPAPAHRVVSLAKKAAAFFR